MPKPMVQLAPLTPVEAMALMAIYREGCRAIGIAPRDLVARDVETELSENTKTLCTREVVAPLSLKLRQLLLELSSTWPL